jgi:hypothetical protein
MPEIWARAELVPDSGQNHHAGERSMRLRVPAHRFREVGGMPKTGEKRPYKRAEKGRRKWSSERLKRVHGAELATLGASMRRRSCAENVGFTVIVGFVVPGRRLFTVRKPKKYPNRVQSDAAVGFLLRLRAIF